MTKQKSSHLVQTAQRRERGTAVPVSTRRVTLADGMSVELQGINLANADVPDRSYFGEICGVRYLNQAVTLMFAQPKLGDDGLRSLVLIAMTPSSGAHFTKSLDDLRNPSLEEIVKQSNIEDRPLSEFPREEPEQTAALTANIVAVAIHGHECCLDFYHANAFSHAAARQSNQMYLDPVVRVTTYTALLWSLQRGLRELKKGYPRDALLIEEVAND